jgi:prepilin-type N-terminal cleavage/methylation domain-containing protein
MMGKCPKRFAKLCCETRLSTGLYKEVNLANRKGEQGFTLIEVIVAIAVVAILAGIITPSVIKHLDDSKRARAQNDCVVISSAIASFYKDVSRMPTKGAVAANNTAITLLVSDGNIPTGVNGWLTAAGAVPCDYLSNHLSLNAPLGVAGNSYPRAGSEFIWRGPYQASFPADPWGNRYAINIGNFRNVPGAAAGANSNAVFVLSAGPDGIVQTAVNPAVPAAGTTLAASGDDIIYRIR